MTLWQFAVGLAGQHLLPCVFASAIMYGILSLLFGPARLRRSGDRVLFLYGALFKAGIALCTGEGVSCLSGNTGVVGYLAFRIPDLVRNGPPFESDVLIAAFACPHPIGAVLLATALSAAVMLCYRWSRLAPLYRRIGKSRRLDVAAVPHVFRLFDGLVARAYGSAKRLPKPKLMVVRNAPSPAFTMGIVRPTVVLSADLVSQLADRELEAVMAHELGHVRRLDYVGRWLATILRDVMCWNPFVARWYGWLIYEQEAATDEYAAKLLGDPVAVASSLVEVSAHAVRLPVVSVGPLTLSRMTREFDTLSQRLGRLEENTLRPHGRGGWPSRIAYAALVGFLLAQPHVVLPLRHLPDLALVSRW